MNVQRQARWVQPGALLVIFSLLTWFGGSSLNAGEGPAGTDAEHQVDKVLEELRAKLLTRGKLEQWLQAHDFKPNALRSDWTKAKPIHAEVGELVKLTGAEWEYAPCGPGPDVDPESYYESPACFIHVTREAGRWGPSPETGELPPPPPLVSVKCSFHQDALPTADSLIVPSLKGPVERLQDILAVQGFKTSDKKRYVLPQTTLAKATAIAAGFRAQFFELNLAIPPSDPVILYGPGVPEGVGFRVQGLSRADWTAGRQDAPVQLEVFLNFGGYGDFPLEDEKAPPLNLERARGMLLAAGFVEQPAGVFTNEKPTLEIALLVPRLGLQFGHENAKLAGWNVSAAVNEKLKMKGRILSWQEWGKPRPDMKSKTIYMVTFGDATFPAPPPVPEEKR